MGTTRRQDPRASARLRICQVVEATGAGVGKHTLDLAEGLASAGHDIHLLYSPTRAEPGWLARLGDRRLYRAHIVSMPRRVGWRAAAAVLATRAYLVAHGPFNVIHGHSSIGGAVARAAAVGLPTSVVYTPHAFAAMNPAGSRAARQVYRNLECALWRITDEIICVSPEEYEFALSLRIPPAKLCVVANGIEHAPSADRDEARNEFGLDPQAIVVGFVGRLSPQKAPDVLLKAFALLVRQTPGVVLAIVGDGPLRVPLHKLAQDSGVAKQVRWLGWRDGRRAMSAFDLFALPSRYEGLPYVAIEALAAGLPLVATSAAGCRLLIDEGRNGFTVPADRPDLLCNAIARVANECELRKSFGSYSADKARYFQIDRMLQETVAVYRRVIGRHLDRHDDS